MLVCRIYLIFCSLLFSPSLCVMRTGRSSQISRSRDIHCNTQDYKSYQYIRLGAQFSQGVTDVEDFFPPFFCQLDQRVGFFLFGAAHIPSFLLICVVPNSCCIYCRLYIHYHHHYFHCYTCTLLTLNVINYAFDCTIGIQVSGLFVQHNTNTYLFVCLVVFRY